MPSFATAAAFIGKYIEYMMSAKASQYTLNMSLFFNASFVKSGLFLHTCIQCRTAAQWKINSTRWMTGFANCITCHLYCSVYAVHHISVFSANGCSVFELQWQCRSLAYKRCLVTYFYFSTVTSVLDEFLSVVTRQNSLATVCCTCVLVILAICWVILAMQKVAVKTVIGVLVVFHIQCQN